MIDCVRVFFTIQEALPHLWIIFICIAVRNFITHITTFLRADDWRSCVDCSHPIHIMIWHPYISLYISLHSGSLPPSSGALSQTRRSQVLLVPLKFSVLNIVKRIFLVILRISFYSRISNKY